MLFAAYPISYASADVKFEANERARPEGIQVVRQDPRKKSSHQNAEGKYHEECMGQIIQSDCGLQERKYFDSGDYMMSKAGVPTASPPGTAHPTPEAYVGHFNVQDLALIRFAVCLTPLLRPVPAAAIFHHRRLADPSLPQVSWNMASAGKNLLIALAWALAQPLLARLLRCLDTDIITGSNVVAVKGKLRDLHC